jgi:hypothetical protein
LTPRRNEKSDRHGIAIPQTLPKEDQIKNSTLVCKNVKRGDALTNKLSKLPSSLSGVMFSQQVPSAFRCGINKGEEKGVVHLPTTKNIHPTKTGWIFLAGAEGILCIWSGSL